MSCLSQVSSHPCLKSNLQNIYPKVTVCSGYGHHLLFASLFNSTLRRTSYRGSHQTFMSNTTTSSSPSMKNYPQRYFRRQYSNYDSEHIHKETTVTSAVANEKRAANKAHQEKHISRTGHIGEPKSTKPIRGNTTNSTASTAASTAAAAAAAAASIRGRNVKNNHHDDSIGTKDSGNGIVGRETTKIPNMKISIVGIGGAGCNGVNNMVDGYGFNENVQFLVVNTDKQCLDTLDQCTNKIQIGIQTTGGLGAGSHPEVGKKSAEENLEEVIEKIKDSIMIFLVAGMGGGTGTGATPVIAAEARKRGILTVGMVYTPFFFEGKQRLKTAEEGLKELEKQVDTLIIFDNEHMLDRNGGNLPIDVAFKMSDDSMLYGIQSITDVILKPGLINLDVADIRTIMTNAGRGILGVNSSPFIEGSSVSQIDPRGVVETALEIPLKDVNTLENAEKLFIGITGHSDVLHLSRVNQIIREVRSYTNDDVIMLHGATTTTDPKIEGIKTCILLTGIPKSDFKKKNPPEIPPARVRTSKNTEKVSSFLPPLSSSSSSPGQEGEEESLGALFRRVIRKIF